MSKADNLAASRHLRLFETSILVPYTPRGRCASKPRRGGSVTIDYAGDLDLETSLPYKVLATPGEEEWPESTHKILEGRLEAITLSGLLAFDRWPPVVLIPTWRIVFDPLAHGPLLSWRDPRGGTTITPFALPDSELDAWREWIQRIDSKRHSSVEVGIRRLISASSQRQDPVDSLVDAVVVWENLFGTRQGEGTLRISGSLAWLLEDNPESRLLRYSEIAKLFGVRSDIVHGNRIVPGNEATNASRLAWRLRSKPFALCSQRVRNC